MPTLLASRFCVSCLRRRAPRNSRPFLMAACSASSDPASSASSRRPGLAHLARPSTFCFSTSAPLSKSGLHQRLAQGWVSLKRSLLPGRPGCPALLSVRVHGRPWAASIAGRPNTACGRRSASFDSRADIGRFKSGRLARSPAPMRRQYPPDEIYDQSRRGVPPAHSNWLICACGIPRAFCTRASRLQRALRAVP